LNEFPTNALGGILETCSLTPLTGFFRNGQCQVTDEDIGNHGVCAVMTEDFLRFSRSRGNDLSTPRPEFDFPGLKAGDRWCLCSARWQEALVAGQAPGVVLGATSAAALEVVKLEDLQRHAVDLKQEPK
jgi:uncharacterized protein (DUF2237 family)